MPNSAVSSQQSAVSSQNKGVRLQTVDRGLWTVVFLLVLLPLSGTAFTYAQDTVPVPPLQAGTLLTFHPICVHFAIALTVFGLGLDWVGSWYQHPQWQYAGRLSFFAGVVATGLAVLSGWIEQELPRPASIFDPQMQSVLFYHEYLG